MPIKVYKLDASPPARAVMMTGELLGLEIEYIDVNLFEGDHKKPEYLKKNPLHTVPLVEDGDFCIHDSHAAMMYLVDKYAKNDSLYPKDLIKRTAVNQILFFNSSVLFTRLRNITYALFMFGKKDVSKQQLDDIHEAYSFLEEFLTRSTYIAGNNMTIADIASFSIVSSMIGIASLDKYPKTKKWLLAMEKESFSKKFNAPGAAILSAHTNKYPKTNNWCLKMENESFSKKHNAPGLAVYAIHTSKLVFDSAREE